MMILVKNLIERMKKILAMVLAGLSLGACGLYNSPTPIPVPPETSTSTEETKMAPRSLVMLAQSGSQQPGTAVLTDLGGGRTQVVITLTGPVSSVAQPAHIHTGSCPNPGAVRYPLNDVVSGRSETVVEADMASLFGTEALAVNVHKSAVEASVYVSCGDLK